MGQQCLPSFPVKADNITFQFIVRNLTKELRQRHDVLLTVTQWRNGYLEIVQTVQQVLTKTLLIDRLFQILVGSGNDTDVKTLIRSVTYRAVSPFLYGTQKHLLGFRCEITHFVQKQRTTFRFMEISFLGTVRTGECAFDMSEECRRRKLFGE